MIERLLDHEQVEIIERSQMTLIRNRVGAVRIDGKQNVRVSSAHLLHYFNVPTGFDLKLDPLITLRQVSVDSIEKAIERGLNAEADAHRYMVARSSDQLR